MSKKRQQKTQELLEQYGFDSSTQRLVKSKHGYVIKEGRDEDFIYNEEGELYSGWKWVPVKGRDTGVYRYVNNGIIENPNFFTATDGTPFSRGGFGVLQKAGEGYDKAIDATSKGIISAGGYLWDMQVEKAKQLAEDVESVAQATNRLFVERINPAVSAVGDRLTPSAQDPNISIQQQKEQEKQERRNATNDILLRWKGGE